MAITTLRSGASAHAEDNVLQLGTDLISSAGVLSLTGNHLLVAQQTSPDMTVKVAVGRAYVKGTSGNAYPVIMDAVTNVSITSNSSGNPRIDAVVLYIDKAATPTTTADNVAKFMVVAGTPAGSPSAPSDGDIQTAVGASNPFLRLANVTVASGATSIVTANIADARVGCVIINGQMTNAIYSDTPNFSSAANTNWQTVTGAEVTVATKKASKVRIEAMIYSAMSTAYSNYGYTYRIIVGASTQVGNEYYFDPAQNAFNNSFMLGVTYTSANAESVTFKLQAMKSDSSQTLVTVDVDMFAFVIPD